MKQTVCIDLTDADRFYLMLYSEDSEKAVGECRHNQIGNQHSQSDNRERGSDSDIEQGGNQCARPAAGSGQGNRNESKKPPISPALDLFALSH